jgi:hypothetical protein
MITLTRRQARRLRGVFRRHFLGIEHRGAIPPLVFRTTGAQLRAQYRYAALAIESVEPAPDQDDGVVALPLDALAELEGRDETPVELEAVAPDRTRVRWIDHGVPQVREHAVAALEALAPFPAPPATWTEVGAGLFEALAEASQTACEENTRYALSCLLLQGAAGAIAATDGRQLLLQRGFSFPWREDLRVRRSPVFTSRIWPADQPVAIGRSDGHIVLRSGPWTLFLEVQTEGRFPVVDHVLPDPQAITTRLRLDPADAAFLRQALDHLPGGQELHAPVTVDLNGQIAIRARGGEPGPATELVLARSRYTGDPVRLSTSRDYLGRALRLGLQELEIATATQPVVCRNSDRSYCWQPLSAESALEPAEDVIRIRSDASEPATAAAPPPAAPPKAAPPVSEPPVPARSPARHETANGRPPAGPASASSLAALIEEAASLQTALADARTRAGRLVVALRRHRKQSRLVRSTLESLRQLRLQEVAE